MRVAALYDIHGNLPALEAALADVHKAGVDRIVVGGDLVPGPMAKEALARVIDLDVPVEFIYGNGEVAVLAYMAGRELDPRIPEHARESIGWNAEHLREQEGLLASWPPTLRLDVPPIGRVLFCHATPRNENDIFTRLTAEERLLSVFAGLDVAMVVCGHTHMQFDRMVGSMRVLNAGSVGMPFGDTGAHWLLIGSDVELRRTSYDLGKAAGRVRQTSYPQAEEFASRYVLNPPTEQQMLDLYAQHELN